MTYKNMKTIAIVTLLAAPLLAAQDRHDWLSLGELQPGDRIRLSLKTGPVDSAFQSWTPQEVTAGTVTTRREDVLKIEQYREGGRGRGQHAAIGALIGFGGGFAIGAAASPNCHQGDFLCPNISRGLVGAAVGGVGAVIGAAIGALVPRHNRKIIYSAK